ncbi:ligand-gated channel protein [Pseudoalteromonas sp. MSK9-3]|uniref:TonB-dependent receptor n=1 Tax=Pseudoalteromonas sp. MSK9-3 TaxID=1897633 RepID=UPI000E6D33F9|nr:TonB-dependent receptor [Pseudoalteromonas sp. MSK9-3]RJE75881.1 ligand-gated channel protein [Pseudoalteromonas sp. MSK9-3]
MLANNFKKSLLALNVGLVLSAGASGVAYAADESKAQEDVEVIEVRGMRRSLEASINTKRFAEGVVDAITAEDIGKFPDKNIAESLKRIPGITVQSQFGEGDAVSIRGAGSDFTKTTLNGQNVASTGWFVLEPAKRSFNYTLLPSELVGGLEVYKSSQADIIEGGVGGTVIVNTRTPLDLDANTMYGSLEFQHSDDSGETSPQLSGMYSWKNEDENLGFLVSAVQQERKLQRQGNESFWAWGAGPVGFEQDRERSALTTTFEYAPTDALSIVVNYLDMKMDANNTNYALWLTKGSNDTQFLTGPGTAEGGSPLAGDLNVAFYQMRPREATMNSDYLDVKLEYAGDNYKVEFVIGDTSSTGGTDFEMVMNDTGAVTLPDGTYDFTGGSQTWSPGIDISTYIPGASAETPDGFLTMGTGSNFNSTPKTDEEQFIQLDVEYMLDNDFITSVKAGFRRGDHEATSRRFEFSQNLCSDTVTSNCFDPQYSLAGQGRGKYDVGADNLQIQSFDVDAMKNWAKASITGKTEDYGSYSHIEEENTAIYVMAKYSGENYRGNFGVRYVQTDASSIYYREGNMNQRTVESADYSEVLPSFNFAYDLDEDKILRIAASKVMTRPQYNDMYFNPSLSGLQDEQAANQKVALGNPGLKPFTANQAEVGVEWYFNPSSLLAVTAFYKDVSNFIVINRGVVSAEESARLGLPTLQGDEAANGWTSEENFNGPGGKVKGVEFQYQQDFGNGFGAIANYTYTDGEADSTYFVNSNGEETLVFSDGNTDLSDSSESAYNLTGYYENDLFYARLSYNYRSSYMLRETGAYGNRSHDGYGSLDVSAVYHVTDNIDIKFDVVNLTGESAKHFGNNTNSAELANNGFAEGFPVYEYEQATRYGLGISVRY